MSRWYLILSGLCYPHQELLWHRTWLSARYAPSDYRSQCWGINITSQNCILNNLCIWKCSLLVQASRVLGERHSLSDISFLLTIDRLCTQSVGPSVMPIIFVASSFCSFCLKGSLRPCTILLITPIWHSGFSISVMVGLFHVTAFTAAFMPFSTMPNSRRFFSHRIGTVSSEVTKISLVLVTTMFMMPLPIPAWSNSVPLNDYLST